MPYSEPALYSELFTLEVEDSADGKDREAAVRTAVQACTQRGIPLAPGTNEVWCYLRMRPGLIPQPYLHTLHATITADVTCNDRALHRLPVTYEEDGNDRIVVTTPDWEAVFGKRRAHIAALLLLITGRRATGTARPPPGPRATLAAATASDDEIGREHV